MSFDGHEKEPIVSAEDVFIGIIQEKLGYADQSRNYELWYEWLSDGASLVNPKYLFFEYTKEEYQKAKLMLGPYSRVIILAWLKAREHINNGQ